MTTEKTIIAYKGFDKDWKCRDFQYEVGKHYTHKGTAELCGSGFHACEAPFDVFSYYKIGNGSNYAQVELGGLSAKTDKDSKRCGTKIYIGPQLTLPMLIKAQVEWVFARTDKQLATGHSGHAAETGDSGHAAATGDYGHAAATGRSGHAAATGDSGHAAATGNYGHAAATGNYGHAAATGYYGHAAATGYSGHAAATGYSGHAAATGDSGHAAATGDYGCAFAGFKGKAKAGKSGSFAIAFYDEKAKRARLIVGTPGEDGIKADTFYFVNSSGKLEEVE